jgi:hypothetical protein
VKDCETAAILTIDVGSGKCLTLGTPSKHPPLDSQADGASTGSDVESARTPSVGGTSTHCYTRTPRAATVRDNRTQNRISCRPQK